jgi:hypothetical protein
VSPALTINTCDAYAEKACIALNAFLPQCTVAKKTEDALITVCHDDTLAVEAYRLEIKESGITVWCSEYMGLRNALATISVMAICRNGQVELPETYIEDAPVAKHRGVMLDLACAAIPYQDLCKDLVLMAKARMNRVQLYLADRYGVCLQLETLPQSCWMEGAYSKQQMKDLCRFAEALGLIIIPEYDMPGHSKKLFEVFEDFRCQTPIPEGKKVSTVCTGEPKVYALFEKLINEILDVFPGPYFHMGGDEIEMLDLKIVCLWDNCPKCRKLREEHGLKDRQEQYNYFVKYVNEIVKKRGRTLIMWSDQMDCPRGALLPKDIIMHFWRVAFPSRGPYIGCSMNAQAALGYQVINSYYPETYAFTGEPIIMTSESLRKWQWDRQPEVEEQYRDRILGSELCAWAYGSKALGDYINRFLPSTTVIFGDKLWNNEILEYTDAYCCQLTRTVLGASVPEGFNVFRAIGDVIPPTDNEKKSYYERVNCSDEELREIVKILSQPDTYFAGDAVRAELYRDCAEYTLKMKNEQ